MTKLSPKIYNGIRQKLFQSNEFKGSKNNKALLDFLLNCSLKEAVPKETTIAAEVFGREKDFHPGEDTLVRVHIHNLRKKLENYYDNEGKHDKFRIEIPKGHYALEIHKVEKKSDAEKPKANYFRDVKRLTVFVITALVTVCAALLIYNIILSNKLRHYEVIPANNPIWSHFLKDEKKTVVVCGDHFFYNLPVPFNKRSIHIRDTWVNSPNEMSNIYYAPDNVRISDQTYFPHSTLWSLPAITNALNAGRHTPIIRPSSNLTSTVIEEQNIIYIGNLRSLGMLNLYMRQAGFYYNNENRTLFYIEQGDTTRFDTESNESLFHKDYAMVLKLRGPRQNSIMILASFFTIGVKEATHYLTNPELLKVVEKELAKNAKQVPEYFKMVIEVSGIQQAGVKVKFVMAKTSDEIISPNLKFLDSLKAQ